MTDGPARGLPPRIYVPILAVCALALLALVGYFLRIALGTEGAALGPASDQGGPNAVGGGTPAQRSAAEPPAPVARLLVEFRGRLQRDPGDRGALEGLAQLYSAAGKYGQALPYYRRALALDAANVEARTDYAAALHATGSDRAALSELGRVLAARPNFAPALYDEGAVAAALGSRALAVAAFQKFLRAAPRDPRADDARAALRKLGA